MANIVYNQFLKKYIKGELTLLEENCYSLVLLKDTYNPDAEEYRSYEELYAAGYEVEDASEYGEGYIAGGKTILFQLLGEEKINETDYTMQFTCGRVSWKNVSLYGENAFRYALVYRKKDGLLISCFDMDYGREIIEDSLVLNWEGVCTVEVLMKKANSSDIDREFDEISIKPLMNCTITKGFVDFGVVLEDKGDIPDDLQSMSRLNAITNEYIDGLFE